MDYYWYQIQIRYIYWTPKVKKKLKWPLILIKDKMNTPACVYYRML